MPNQIIIDDLLGKPFDLSGKNGYNCYSLCVEVCKRAGILIPEKQPIENLPERSEGIKKGLYEYFTQIEKPEPFCLVTFKVRPPYVTHIGVVMSDCRTFIHIMKKCKVVVERLDHILWKKKIDGFYVYGK